MTDRRRSLLGTILLATSALAMGRADLATKPGSFA